MTDNTSGRRWARWTLTLMLLLSVAGNIGHTLFAASSVPLWMRVTGAVIWPFIAFLGIEIFVRVIWQSSRSHRFARVMILAPVIPAAITSYEHLHAFLLLMGERGFVAMIGPAAVDGLMIGSTLVLLFTRITPSNPISAIQQEEKEYGITQPTEPRIDWDRELKEWSTPIPTSPAPVKDWIQVKDDEIVRAWGAEYGKDDASSVTEVIQAKDRQTVQKAVTEVRARAPRSSWDAAKVCQMAADGASSAEMHDATGIGASTADRYRRVVKALRADSMAEIGKSFKVPAEHVTMLRRMVTR